MKFTIEYELKGEIEIDTDGTDWLAEEVDMQVSQAIIAACDAPVDRVSEEFDDCEILGEPAEADYSVQRIS